MNLIFPLPHVFPPPSFPLCMNLREPTTSAPRGATLGARIERYRPFVMPLVHGRKKSTLARSLVLIVKLDARYGHRPAIPIPSTKLHIPLISRLRMSERYDFLTSFAIFEIKETIATSTRKPPKSFLSNSPFASVAKNEQPTQAIIDGTSI